MEKKYTLSKNGAQTGPFSFSRVSELITSGNILWSDYIFSIEKNDWIMMVEHVDFAEKFLPKIAGKDQTSTPSLTDKAWYILRDGNNYGPFSKIDLIQMLQNKSLYEFDFVWQTGRPAWSTIAETPEFSSENIRKVREQSDIDVSEVFFRRRHLRAKFGSSLIVHNSKSVFRGHGLEISAGGAGIVLENPNIQPGQSLFLHFKPGEGVPPFNAICQVVSKHIINVGSGKETKKQVKYGVRFTSISSQVKDSIEAFTKSQPSAS